MCVCDPCIFLHFVAVEPQQGFFEGVISWIHAPSPPAETTKRAALYPTVGYSLESAEAEIVLC